MTDVRIKLTINGEVVINGVIPANDTPLITGIDVDLGIIQEGEVTHKKRWGWLPEVLVGTDSQVSMTLTPA